MELNVNTVYTTVLSILNKEQRGYMTPDEFNKVATQVQLEIFEGFFQDLNQYLRMPKTDEEFASRIAHVEEEMQVFEEYESASSSVTDNIYTVPLQGGVLTGIVSTGGTGYNTSTTAQATTGGSGTGCKVNITANGAVASFTIGSTGSGYKVGDDITISGGNGDAKITVNSLTSGVYRLGSVYFNAVPGTPQIELVGRKEYKQQLMSTLTQPSKSFPIGILKNDKVEVYPKVTTFNPARAVNNNDIKFSYIRKPKDVTWGYSIGNLGQYIYDSRTYSPSMLLIGSSFNPSTIPGGTTVNAQSLTYQNIPTTTSGSGSGAVLNAQVSGSGNVAVTSSNIVFSINSTLDKSSGYAVGDTLTVAAGAFGNLSQNIILTAITANQLAGTNPTTQGSIQFEVDASNQTTVVLEILKYSGIIIRDPQIIQAAQQELVQDEANEKR